MGAGPSGATRECVVALGTSQKGPVRIRGLVGSWARLECGPELQLQQGRALNFPSPLGRPVCTGRGVPKLKVLVGRTSPGAYVLCPSHPLGTVVPGSTASRVGPPPPSLWGVVLGPTLHLAATCSDHRASSIPTPGLRALASPGLGLACAPSTQPACFPWCLSLQTG